MVKRKNLYTFYTKWINVESGVIYYHVNLTYKP